MINIRLEAYKIIHKVTSKNVFSDKLLTMMSRDIRDAGENADLLYVLVKGVIKMQKHLDHIASLFTEPKKFASTNIKIKILLYIGLYQLIYCDNIPEYAAVNETVALARKLYNEKIANFINAVLRSYLRSKKIEYPENVADRISLEYSFPRDFIDKWLKKWGAEKTEMLCMYYNDVPKLHIRINTLATEKQRITDYFERRNIKITPSTASSNILITEQARDVLNEIAFTEGYYSVQDASAAMVVELMNPQMYESILDLFAAPGGKATYISELMGNTGEMIAVDKFPNKIKKLKHAVERLKISNMKFNAVDAFKFGPVAPAYDRVLLDVPCSGWGVFQKKAELRWQINQDVPKLLKLQENALKTGAAFVKSGGYLVYSTCTMNEEENEKQVERFLAKNKDFQLIPAEKYIPECFTQNGFLKTIPFEHNMDGAFAAKLIKK